MLAYYAMFHQILVEVESTTSAMTNEKRMMKTSIKKKKTMTKNWS